MSGRAKRRVIPRLGCRMEGEYPAKSGADGRRGAEERGIRLTSERVSRMYRQ
jgi:hypothetical protein